MGSPPLEPSRDEAQELLREELADPEYQRAFTGPLRDAIDAVLAWLGERALSIGGVEIPYGPLVLVVLLAAAILLCILLVRPRLQRAGGVADELLNAETGLSAEDLRARASAHGGAERFGDAYRPLFRAVVRSAEERGLLSEQAGRTASEAARAVGRLFPREAEALHRCGELFNLSHYGGRALSVQDVDQLRQLEETLRRAEPNVSGDAAYGSARLVVPE